ncbi:uncharacterized protein LAESUDRAFT_656177 [Laetiporus sulphureus 93-53]|uniref:Uncharacterized protein n=1 Tax=Laetiporus sulphureus 93-53 TaxID=1314785 RepID=A0A165DNT4_9APHY|nr:uncharacterized protein LAESUDRAFT_656177 [Laetiporus sulphureus 93-53]KZT05292.1 hypothetical protein LAESUDRAFT_656177 [Laetiporus sulphureus 93-53]
MPGPRNMKKKKQVESKKAKRNKPLPDKPTLETDACDVRSHPPASHHSHHASETSVPDTISNQVSELQIWSQPPSDSPDDHVRRTTPYTYDMTYEDAHLDADIPPIFTKKPFIHDPGNGPRVRDTRAFLASTFASPPSLEDPLCAEFAQDEMLEMLSLILPEETALVLWYNKSRKTARVCPACQRLYRLGDVLPKHLNEEALTQSAEHMREHLYREQAISGLCSSVCFMLAALNYPGAISSTWGRMAEELGDATWDLLDGPGTNAVQNDRGLSLLLKMTRCADLGLGELLFPEDDVDDLLDGEGSHTKVVEDRTWTTPTFRDADGVELAEQMGGLRLRAGS